MSTILCGSTVEFELALLTLAFLAGNQEGDNPPTLGGEAIDVKWFPVSACAMAARRSAPPLSRSRAEWSDAALRWRT
jgi:hypothetical protein